MNRVIGMFRSVRRPTGWTLVLGVIVVWPLAGQVVGREGLVTREGLRLDLEPDGGWRVRSRVVADTRLALRAQGRWDVLNADRARRAVQPALAGDFWLPSVLLAYAGSDTTAIPSGPTYDSLFYHTVPAAGRPYSLRSYYAELSNGAFDIRGSVVGWVPVDSSLGYVTEPCAGSGGLCTLALRRLADAFRTALTAVDPAMDFGQFDNDGPDNQPNSGDDDGVVDVIQFIQPVIGAECGGPGVWAHKGSLTQTDPAGGVYVTSDPAASGGTITVNSYIVSAGVGGPACDDASAAMGIGLSAHELGHALGLPDLYDTGGSTHGIGEWGLMGSGMYTSLSSPSHMSAWSKERLGWITVRELTADGTYGIGPSVASDTAFLVRPAVPNPRGEYFLVENRQGVQADSATILTGGKAGPKKGGLLVWHIDSTAVAVGIPGNTVNAFTVHGVALVQADGTGLLDRFGANGNRGDAGDPFPGDSARTRYSFATVPAARLNHNGSFVGFQLSAITQIAPLGAMELDLTVGLPNVVRATDTIAVITVDSVPYRRFIDFFDPALPYTIAIDSLQNSGDGRSRFVFVHWSNGGAASHVISGLPRGDSVVATVDALHRVRVAIVGDGSVQVSAPGDYAAGVFLPRDSVVTLTGIPGAGRFLDNWFGDTTALGPVLTIPVTRPFDVSAEFVDLLRFDAGDPPAPIVGAPYQFRLTASGGFSGERRFRLESGVLPPGLTLTPDGVVAGIPVVAGEYSVLVEVASGAQVVIRDLALDAAAPTLDIDEVLADVIGFASNLDESQRRYLDLIGNGNGSFDIGDFLAWVDLVGRPQGLPRGSVRSHERRNR